jgi:predicted restriction endonuclease
MKKYSALSNHLSNIKADSVELEFSKIEEIIGGSLPPSALRHDAWWANETRGTHKWSHLWQAAGWFRDKVDFRTRVVTFRRHTIQIDDALEKLVPTTKETIYDLLALAGISTEAWFTKNDRQPVKNVKANPRFCYEWSFGSLRECYALCIWQKSLYVEGTAIVFEENLRALAKELQEDSRKATNDEARRHRSLKQSTRARDFDDALNVSYARGLPVSVILTEGDRRTRDQMGEGSSHVQFRALDPIKWFVHRYDEETGDVILVRGIKPESLVQDNEIDNTGDIGSPDDVQQRAIKIRRGQAKFREGLLAAYGRTCAVTGCKIVDLLEAAHIHPHSDEPNYSITNGLLLRADIHTLFDLNLLAVDTRLRVTLSPTLLNSEYKNLNNRELKHPQYPSEMPNAESLDRRYRQFREKQGL